MMHTLADLLRQFHIQGQGVFSCDLIRIDQALAWISAESPRARSFGACLQQLVQKIENGSNYDCLCCDHGSFTPHVLPSLFVFCFPTGNTAMTGMLSGLCSDCSSRPSEVIFADVQHSLLGVWPALKIIGKPTGTGHG